ncbi:ATP-binding protein [Streptomyces bobili]|uniref:ATP-binding protein n=1 Tax=Streptomyces bobili TaxID=67280 RepID=UPI0036ED315E
MANAAVRKHAPPPSWRAEVMDAQFTIGRRSGDAPAIEDACRVGIMRRIAAARLRCCGLQALTDDVTLIVSELLTNALLHSGTSEIRLKLTVEEGLLRIAVSDGVPSGMPPGPGPAGEDAESGRGLILVAALAQDQGGAFGISDRGTTAWCTLALPPQEAS